MNKWDVIAIMYWFLAAFCGALVLWFWFEAWRNRLWFPLVISMPFIALCALCLKVAQMAGVTILRQF